MVVVPNRFCNPPFNRSNIFEKDWSNFNEEKFIFDSFPIDWNEGFKIKELLIVDF